ncbi:hypothetical protein BofuT4_P009130.1 [Botrytis cinerea T4]|uniref:Uncharacterized protein n=1 Tax=Botryotinia fuckeliana (strain T4) TaxID=999810 RepID=G2XXB8_BOTF4|nr:hypothetical protein BofuT4_P009130.1 [Botrytis cinerea T4]
MAPKVSGRPQAADAEEPQPPTRCKPSQGVPEQQIPRNRNHGVVYTIRVSPSGKYRGTVTTDLSAKFGKTLKELLCKNNTYIIVQ